jgi:hypothetical protein
MCFLRARLSGQEFGSEPSPTCKLGPAQPKIFGPGCPYLDIRGCSDLSHTSKYILLMYLFTRFSDE